MTNADQIIKVLESEEILDDDEIALRINKRRQIVNQECRLLARRWLVERWIGGHRRKFVNRLIEANARETTDYRQNELLPPPTSNVQLKEDVRLAIGYTAINIGAYEFDIVSVITPQHDSFGVRKYFPQSSYANASAATLHKYGHGPFCKFKTVRDLYCAGIYALIVDEEVLYIGQTQNLSERLNGGYGNISPRNCFIGGQQTNCRINNLIYDIYHQKKT